jgi:hypothetical protein
MSVTVNISADIDQTAEASSCSGLGIEIPKHHSLRGRKRERERKRERKLREKRKEGRRKRDRLGQ